jgi:hypothetical protein
MTSTDGRKAGACWVTPALLHHSARKYNVYRLPCHITLTHITLTHITLTHITLTQPNQAASTAVVSSVTHAATGLVTDPGSRCCSCQMGLLVYRACGH